LITIFGKSACSYCLRAKKLAERYGFEYEYKNVEYEHYYNQMIALKEDVQTVPQIWWHDKYIGGYDEFAREIENTFGGYGEGKL
jgi:glutaredoxin 1